MALFGLLKTSKRRTKHTEKGRVAGQLRAASYGAQHYRAATPAERKEYNIPASCRSGPKGYCTVHTGKKWGSGIPQGRRETARTR